MIPIPNGSFQNIIFKNVLDIKYRTLLEKEFKFCESIQDDVLRRVNKVYKKQKETGIIGRANCNFSKLEEAMLLWEKERLRTEKLKSTNILER